MTGVRDGDIVALRGLEAVVEPYDWVFAREQAEAVRTHWAKVTADKPAMFDGRVLLQHRGAIENGVFKAGYFETNYASFLAWRDFGQPGPAIRNGFAMAALRAADGAFLCGRMGAHTANGGQVYFAAGTPDPSDVRDDGRVDLAGSVTRELEEETGLGAADIAVEESWTAVILPGRVAFMRPVSVPLGAEAARALMLARMKGLHEEELSDIVVIRDAADADRYAMPPFMRPYLDHIWQGEQTLSIPG